MNLDKLKKESKMLGDLALKIHECVEADMATILVYRDGKVIVASSAHELDKEVNREDAIRFFKHGVEALERAIKALEDNTMEMGRDDVIYGFTKDGKIDTVPLNTPNLKDLFKKRDDSLPGGLV